MQVRRIVLVTKPTPLEELVRAHLTERAAQFSLEATGQSIAPYKKEDAAYKAALALLRRQFPNDVPAVSVTRDELPYFLFRDTDLVVVCGPDGLFANVAQHVGAQPIIAVNPDPNRIAGALMRFPPQAVGQLIAHIRQGKFRYERLPMVKATVTATSGETEVVWGINDVFIGRNDQISARYRLNYDNQTVSQISSGIIVATGIGATGWMQSVIAMYEGLSHTRRQPDELLPLPAPISTELVFVVREPFPSPTTDATVVTGSIYPNTPLRIISDMPSGGCVFSDGVPEKAVAWDAGSVMEVSVGDRFITRVI